eukprot:CAMPEP_0201557486 /NCGR_PEP_ID=MMETSP0173_2-20130828/62164_1 /ASSEMBLY_ACC=CAM_ASM_000268 /TAXON_ID=218659 /ORGANISM="Vexillifera sp., Strain DIVA3 564/2" /LENGTH=499 /DNA_ID=CAMNT_0047970359 /DNA_START=1636 /DNA_END=3131 /DNA_ORIENTATION=-
MNSSSKAISIISKSSSSSKKSRHSQLVASSLDGDFVKSASSAEIQRYRRKQVTIGQTTTQSKDDQDEVITTRLNPSKSKTRNSKLFGRRSHHISSTRKVHQTSLMSGNNNEEENVLVPTHLSNTNDVNQKDGDEREQCKSQSAQSTPLAKRSRSATTASHVTTKGWVNGKSSSKRDQKDRALLNSLIFSLTPVHEGQVKWKKNSNWKKKWAIVDKQNMYLFKNTQDILPPVSIGLLGSCVKRIPNKHSTFQVLTTGDTYTFSTETDKEMYEWVTHLTLICENLVMTSIDPGSLQNNGSDSSVPQQQSGSSNESASRSASSSSKQADLAPQEKLKQEVIDLQASQEGNQQCADCSKPDPEWASTNLGIFICIGCSGTHRRLGTHISKVRSLRLDKWLPEHVEILKSIGNVKSNKVWEYKIPNNVQKPTPTTHAEEREQYIRMKYQQGRFRKDADIYAASQKTITLTGQGLKEAILHLLKVDVDFRKEVRHLLVDMDDDDS